jgi:hypothetical protein
MIGTKLTAEISTPDAEVLFQRTHLAVASLCSPISPEFLSTWLGQNKT